MSALLLLALAVSSYLPPLPVQFIEQQQKKVSEDIRFIRGLVPVCSAGHASVQSINDLDLMLHNEAPHLNQQVINKVLMTLKCANDYNVDHNHILTIIDYSMPSNEKRLWVFDLKEQKLLFHTYVSHGIKSGALVSNYFSNKYNSKASSIGVYQTQQAYYGRDGLSLRLDGLDRSFNDNASNRSVVMHSGWYVEESFIKKYGRPGRSWGCPALPLENSKAIINAIKDKSLLVIYYPSDTWFSKSRFLNCDKDIASRLSNQPTLSMPATAPDDQREAILFIGSGYRGKATETNPVAVISAEVYQRIFHTTAPLKRMLRRQINNAEYIALSTSELNYLANNNAADLSSISFVIPTIKEVRGGYFETQMQMVNLGKIKEVKANGTQGTSFTIYFEGRPTISLNASNQFIRWVGL
ncbi:MAG: murein L,D-transpeptidase catalytic domain family protein [Legionella sp.]|uniref:murein L,D-transpeptidase catalytic domain family protein n=1 Tax=Legionella sp. TaxID=459 RepID=UPI00284C26F1|nr:murein L,D-transpeptidase catalytic domain family protein [Legionella sp.]